MSAPIRPLPVAPQRTESDATINSKPDEGSGFGEVLDLHLSEKADEKKEPPGKEPEKKPNEVDGSAWALLGVQLTNPAVTLETPTLNLAEPGHSCPQEQGATCLVVGAAATVEGAETDAEPQPDGPADKNVRAPSDAVEGTIVLDQIQKLAPAPQVQKLPPPLESKPEEVAGKPVESGEKLRGIPAAKQGSMLLNSENQDKAGSQEQQAGRFQVPQMEAASEQVRVMSRPIVKTVERPIEFPADKAVADLAHFDPSIRVESPSALPETHRLTEARAVAVVDTIREQVWLLRAAKANELNVVLRPDANTELVLQLRQVDGQVHLQARCERGDFSWLDSQWSAVQNTLAQQGVRVEPLQGAYRAQEGSGNSMFMPDERGSRQRQEQNFSFEQESSKNSKNSSRPAKTGTRTRGWQSWA